MQAGSPSSRGLLSVVLIAAAFASTAVIAQQSTAGGAGLAAGSLGWHRGLALRGFQAGDNRLQLSGAMPSIFPKTEANIGFKFFGGYRFGPSFALEGGFADPGKFDATRDMAAPAFGATSSWKSGFRLDAIGIVPLRGGFSLFGRIGTLYSPTRNPILASGGMFSTAFTDPSQTRFEWKAEYGLGASYDVSRSIGLHFKYEHANSYFGEARTSETNAGVWSLGLIKLY
ncbi:MAG: outer membrane beta-barrel protein [Pseudomonadota bacterium]